MIYVVWHLWTLSRLFLIDLTIFQMVSLISLYIWNISSEEATQKELDFSFTIWRWILTLYHLKVHVKHVFLFIGFHLKDTSLILLIKNSLKMNPRLLFSNLMAIGLQDDIAQVSHNPILEDMIISKISRDT